MRTITLGKRMTAVMFLAALLSATAAGCGGIKTGNVSGVVTFRDKPMPGGYINFFSIGADGSVIGQKSVEIGSDGTYSLAKVPLGDVKITVQAPAGALEENKTEKGGMPRRAPSPVTLPAEYQTLELTDLKYTIAPGDQKHNVEMK